jgi:hypothetical protein
LLRLDCFFDIHLMVSRRELFTTLQPYLSRLVDAKRTYEDSRHKKGTLTVMGHIVEMHVADCLARLAHLVKMD